MAFLDITLRDIAAGVLQDRAAERASTVTLQNVQQQNKTLIKMQLNISYLS